MSMKMKMYRIRTRREYPEKHQAACKQIELIQDQFFQVGERKHFRKLSRLDREFHFLRFIFFFVSEARFSEFVKRKQ